MDANGYEVVTIQECFWEEICKDNLKTAISSLIFLRSITADQIMTAIQNDAYGFLLCDIEPCSEESNKFIELNWLPIIHNANVERSDLSPHMDEATKHIHFPRRTVVQTMHAEKILLHTELIKFYLSQGFKITKIYDFFEFEASACFDQLYTKLYESRVEATEQHDDTKATAIKLVGNSSFGQSIMVGIPILL